MEMETAGLLKATLFKHITNLNCAFMDIADTLLVPMEKDNLNRRDYNLIEDMRTELHRAHACIAALKSYTAQIGAPKPRDRYFNFTHDGECVEVSREEYAGSLDDTDIDEDTPSE